MFLEDPVKWSSDDAKALRDFLKSDVGQLTLNWLSFRAPGLLDGSDSGKTLVASGIVRGYQLALSELVSLTREQPAEIKPVENYPDLSDDSKWPEVP